MGAAAREAGRTAGTRTRRLVPDRRGPRSPHPSDAGKPRDDLHDAAGRRGLGTGGGPVVDRGARLGPTAPDLAALRPQHQEGVRQRDGTRVRGLALPNRRVPPPGDGGRRGCRPQPGGRVGEGFADGLAIPGAGGDRAAGPARPPSVPEAPLAQPLGHARALQLGRRRAQARQERRGDALVDVEVGEAVRRQPENPGALFGQDEGPNSRRRLDTRQASVGPCPAGGLLLRRQRRIDRLQPVPHREHGRPAVCEGVPGGRAAGPSGEDARGARPQGDLLPEPPGRSRRRPVRRIRHDGPGGGGSRSQMDHHGGEPGVRRRR